MAKDNDQRAAQEEFERLMEAQERTRKQRRESLRKAAWFERIESLPAGTFLHALLALLLFDVKTRIAALCLLVFAVSVGITIPKIWRTTPESVGDVRVSLLDMAQAAALARSARQAAAEQDYDTARYSWHSAIANNIGHRAHVREFLETELAWGREDSNNIDPYAASYAEYLLQLTETNRTDLRLVVNLYETIGLWERLVTLVEGVPEEDRGLEETIGLLKGLFGQAQFTEFRTVWLSLPDGMTQSEELEGYRLAHQALWGSDTVSELAVRSFRARVRDPRASTQLIRIWAQVALARSNLDDYELALNALDLGGMRALSDDVRHWVLTAEVNGVETAQELARRTALPARTPNEAKFMTQGLIALGMAQEVRPFLEEYVADFGASITFAPLYLTSLLRENDWNAIVEYCLELRRSPLANVPWFATYIAGIEALARDPRGAKGAVRSAWERFDRGVKNLPAPLGLQLAQSFSQRGEFDRARTLLDALESQSSEAVGYWEVALRVASGSGDAEGLLKASRALRELNPQLLDYQLAYALGLLYAGRDVGEAFEVLERLADVAQHHPKTRLTRAMAFLENGQVEEADAELGPLVEEPSESLSVPTLRLLQGRIAVAREQWDVANDVFGEIDVALLSFWERRTLSSLLETHSMLRPVLGITAPPSSIQ